MSSIAIVDVHYRESEAAAAAVLAAGWTAATPTLERVVHVARVEPYEPGAFYRRELPCLLAVLRALPSRPEIVVVDGYVVLGDAGEPGLGAHLYDALGGTTRVVGIAKAPYRGSAFAVPVVRGSSARPLFVTSRGMDAGRAASHVRDMHGAHRIPTLVARADRLARGERFVRG